MYPKLMEMPLEYEPVRQHFQSNKLDRYSRSVYDNYDWSAIMSERHTWMATAEIEKAYSNFETSAAVCFQWLRSFVEAFDNDAFTYDEEGWRFQMAVKAFSDHTLSIYDSEEATPELRDAIVAGYDWLNNQGTLHNYGFLDINGIIKRRGWNIEVIDFTARYDAERRARETARETAFLNAIENEVAVMQHQYIEEHYVCGYEEPAPRFACRQVRYPLFSRKSENLPRRVKQSLKKLHTWYISERNTVILMQRLEGYIRAAQLCACRGNTQSASIINNATILYIKDLRHDKVFLELLGPDQEILVDLDRILRNAQRLSRHLEGF